MKRIISALLSATLLAGVAAMPAAAAETYSLGDVTMDGVVDVGDAVMVLQIYNQGVVLGQDLSQLYDNIETRLQLANVYVDEGSTDSIPDSADAAMILEYYTINALLDFDLLTMEYFVETYDEYHASGSTSFYADQTTKIIMDIPETAETVTIDGFGTLPATVGDYRMTRYTVYQGNLQLQYRTAIGNGIYIGLSPATEERIAELNARFDADTCYSTIELVDLQAHYCRTGAIRWDQNGYWVDVADSSLPPYDYDALYDTTMAFSTLIYEMIEAM